MNPKILLVDDEPSLVKLVKKRLETEGFDVCVALDGEEALEKMERETPDLLVLDVMLPKLSGFDVCRRLKKDPRFSRIPILLFTALAQEKDEKAGLECGANGYVRKPFRAPELLEKIRALLPPRAV